MRIFILLVMFLLFQYNLVQAQKATITLLDSSTKKSIRGLSIVNDSMFWCSGNNGMVARSINGGKNIIWQKIVGYEKRDFRDIEAFDAKTAIIMAVAEPAIILKTTDGGITWKNVFEDTTKGMFLDAMDFDDKGNGVVIGDPIADKLFIATTKNYGTTWMVKNGTELTTGEAFFASSGSNVKVGGNKKFVMVTGGKKSSIIINNSIPIPLNIIQGKESTGANSIDVYKNEAVIVGGDFAEDTLQKNNCILLDFDNQNKLRQTQPTTAPHGYRSSVTYINSNTLICCGTSGVDISFDGGFNWELISNQSFHVVKKAKEGNSIFLAGSKGKIARLEIKNFTPEQRPF